MNELNSRLQDVFLFQPSDLRANRKGQFSPRQQARRRMGGATMWLALGVFAAVMLCTIGIIAFGAWQSGAFSDVVSGEMLTSLVVIAAVVGIVIVAGVLISWRYMSAARTKQISIATGTAAYGKVNAGAAQFEIVIGATKLRLLTEEQQTAFEPGVAYRVFYLAGPAPTVLSAELVGTEAESEIAGVEAEGAPGEEDVVILRQRRAVPILIGLAGLAVCIPVAGIAATALPENYRLAGMVVLCFVALGFGLFATWFLGRRS
jgi:hypothetical protein